MHNNYHFLRHLIPALKESWMGASILSLYTQEKNELIILARDADDQEIYLKAHLSPSFCCLSFPDAHQRARRNSMNLFRDLEDREITSIHLYENERAFCFLFRDDFRLVFKLFGNKSNVVLFNDRRVREVFRSELQNDLNLNPDLDRPIDQDYEQFERVRGDYKQLFPTFGPLPARYLTDHGYDRLELPGKWKLIEQVLYEMEAPGIYVVEEDDYYLTLFSSDSGKKFNDPVAALNYFFRSYFMDGLLSREKKDVLKRLEKNISRSEKYLKKLYHKLESLAIASSYRQQADLLMAHMHSLESGQKKVTLPDFYDPDHKVEISLNPRLSIQDNASHLYQKAKKQHLEVEQIEENIHQREAALKQDQSHAEAIAGLDDLRSLRDYLSDHGLTPREHAENQEKLPYHEFDIGTFKVRVGRNARGNDEMLQKYSFKDDLWLHAKDVPGSHVLIKYQAGKPFPGPVIEKAASLAAFYSKRRNDTLCPVIVTRRKYVRKRKGDAAGMVVVDREEKVFLVPPSTPE